MVFGLLLYACNVRELVPHELMLTVNDFPPGWSHDKLIDIPKVAGADARRDSFHYGQGKYWLVTGHQLVVYSDTASAIAAFPIWEKEWYPEVGDWRQPSAATFVPSNPKDHYRLGCTQVVLDIGDVTSCLFLQQHGRLISLITANLDPQAMTLEQFEMALARLDLRFQSWDPTARSTP